jgi:hypothetical protein
LDSGQLPADALQTICYLDLAEIQAIDPPRGFGRDRMMSPQNPLNTDSPIQGVPPAVLRFYTVRSQSSVGFGSKSMVCYATFDLWRVIMACNLGCTPCFGSTLHIARRKQGLYPGGRDGVQYALTILLAALMMRFL